MSNLRLFVCVLGMAISSRVQVPNTLYSRSVSQWQGCPGRLGIRRKLEANMGAYEQELYTRRGDMGDVAKQTKARHCTEYHPIDAGATSIESRLLTPGDLLVIRRGQARLS